MMQYVEINNLLYEINNLGQIVIVKSAESTSRAYLRFTNKTGRPVDIWWRDFEGKRHHYVRLEAHKFYDINTFLTHPWEFTDAATKERYVINNDIIFRAPPDVGGMLYRTNWNVTVTVRSLRHTALLTMASALRSACSVRAVGLPRMLETELMELTSMLHGRPPVPNE